MSDFPSALELFEQFRPRFERIELRPIGWLSQDYKQVQLYGLLNYRAGKEVKWHDRYTCSFVDIKESGLQVTFTYDPSSEADILSQFSKAVAHQVTAMLSGRIFRLAPAEPFECLVDEHGREVSRRLNVELIGDPLPGLSLYNSGYNTGESGYWDSFVPRGTPEAEAIQAALTYHYKQSLKARDVATEQQEAKVRLEKALVQIA
ncbi:MAG: hypothetical protein AB202_03170 [Parcubacteria bacterium C7867-007]|nr:MAG: hypothetical protein AB202_03170 [Parcubacteria bacterium C7867-007]